MDKNEIKKKTSVLVPILWTFTTVIWAIAVYINLLADVMPTSLLVLQFFAVISSGAAAIVNFVRYKRDRSDKSA